MNDKESKVKKNLTLSPDTLQYVNKYIQKHNEVLHKRLSVSQAIDNIVAEHKNMGVNDLQTDKFIKAFDEKYGNLFNAMKRSVSATDINVQVIIEILNSLVTNLEVEQFYDSKDAANSIIIESKFEVRKNIAHTKQQKDNAKIKNSRT